MILVQLDAFMKIAKLTTDSRLHEPMYLHFFSTTNLNYNKNNYKNISFASTTQLFILFCR